MASCVPVQRARRVRIGVADQVKEISGAAPGARVVGRAASRKFWGTRGARRPVPKILADRREPRYSLTLRREIVLSVGWFGSSARQMALWSPCRQPEGSGIA